MNFKKAIKFLKLLKKKRRHLIDYYRETGFTEDYILHHRDWEVFVGLLYGVQKADKYCDLRGFEVKSSKYGRDTHFEYQYQRQCGLEKLQYEHYINHVYCVYGQDYNRIWIYQLHGQQLRAEFAGFKTRVIDSIKNNKLRCRCRMPFSIVKGRGKLVYYKNFERNNK